MKVLHAHLIISGRVQGVCYRAVTAEEAARLGLNGWVRNLYTGKVEAVFEAPENEREKIEAMIQWCHQGPPGARVSSVKIDWVESEMEFPDFRILPSL
jgi:acylphosphatase